MHSKVARDTGWSFLLRSVGTGLGFLVTVLLARLLGAEGYGVYAYALALLMLLALPAQAGLPTLTMRETARNLALDRPERIRGLWIWAGKLVGILSIVLVLAGGAVLLYRYDGQLDSQTLTIIWAFLLVPLAALGDLRGGALRGLDRIVAGQLPEFVLRPGFLLVLLGGLSLLVGPLTAPRAMALHVVAATLAFGFGTFLLWKHTPQTVREAEPQFEARAWLASALPLALTTGMVIINGYADIVMLGLFESPDQVGIYRIAVQVAALASFGLNAVNMVVAPRFATLYANRDMARLQRLVTGSARWVLVFSLCVALFLVIFGRPLLGLVFGTEFVAAYLPLVILLVGQLFNSAAGSVGHLLTMTGHERDEVRVVTVAAGVNILLNLLLIPLWGMSGAAIATAVSLSIWRFWLMWYVRRRLGVDSLAFTLNRQRNG